jgi:hypothetical protein
MKQYEFTTTHALSILVILLVFIFLIEPLIFRTMTNTFLGRFTLLFILIVITSYNFVYGLVFVLFIIAIYEYYNRFEGAENMSETIINHSKDKSSTIKPNEYGSISSHAEIPLNEHVQDISNNAMDTTKKTELESQIQKGNSSKQLYFTSNTSNKNVLPSESTTTTLSATKQGFSNMFGSEYSKF